MYSQLLSQNADSISIGLISPAVPYLSFLPTIPILLAKFPQLRFQSQPLSGFSGKKTDFQTYHPNSLGETFLRRSGSHLKLSTSQLSILFMVIHIPAPLIMEIMNRTTTRRCDPRLDILPATRETSDHSILATVAPMVKARSQKTVIVLVRMATHSIKYEWIHFPQGDTHFLVCGGVPC